MSKADHANLRHGNKAMGMEGHDHHSAHAGMINDLKRRFYL